MPKTSTAAPKRQPSPTTSKLDRIEPKTALALLLWKNRHHNPSLAETIYEQDVEALEACLAYQKLEAEVVVIRPAGRPAQPEQPGTETRSAVPARAAEPPKNFVVVALVEKGTTTADNPGNAITPIENNQEDYDKAMLAKKLKRVRSGAADLAARLRNDAAQGIFSTDTVNEAAEAIDLLAKA